MSEPASSKEWMTLAQAALRAATVMLRRAARQLPEDQQRPFDAAADYAEAIADQMPKADEG